MTVASSSGRTWPRVRSIAHTAFRTASSGARRPPARQPIQSSSTRTAASGAPASSAPSGAASSPRNCVAANCFPTKSAAGAPRKSAPVSGQNHAPGKWSSGPTGMTIGDVCGPTIDMNGRPLNVPRRLGDADPVKKSGVRAYAGNIQENHAYCGRAADWSITVVSAATRARGRSARHATRLRSAT